MQFETLYHQGRKGAIYSWKIYTEGNEICTEYGQIDGKKQLERKPVQGKNIGKSNETTPQAQAESEAASKHRHKLERKYSTTVEAAKDPVFLPMLANSWEKCKKKVTYPVSVQRKLDGVRCMAFWHGDSVKLLSRGGKEWKIPHIAGELEKFLPEDLVFDGEIYIHGMLLQDINKLVKKHRPGPEGSERLEYWVYDCFKMGETEMVWDERGSILSQIGINKNHERNKVCINGKGWVANSEEEIIRFQQQFIKDGYEGAIVRCLDGDYNLGHRSRKLLKVKSFLDEEFKVIGFTHGEGRASKCVIWICETKEGKEFNVFPRGTFEERENWLEHGDDYVGKMLNIRFSHWSEENKPQQPIGITFRLPEDM